MKREFPPAIGVSLSFLAIFAFLIFLYVGSDILVPLAFGVFLSLVLYPYVRKLEKLGLHRVLAISICLVIVLALFGFALFLVTAQLINLVADFPNITEQVLGGIRDAESALIDRFPAIQEEVVDLFRQSLRGLLDTGKDFLSGTVATTTDLVIVLLLVPIYVFMFLMYRGQFKEFIYRLAPREKMDNVERMISKSQSVIRNYVSGMITVIVILAIFNSIGLSLLGIDYAVFFGILAAVMTLIPFVGIVIGAIPPFVLALLTKDSLWYPAGVLIVFAIVQGIGGNIITPRIVGGKVSVNPVTALVAMFVGAKIWGMAGLILFIPLVAVLKVFFDAFEPLKPFGVLLGVEESERAAGATWTDKIGKWLRSLSGKKKEGV